MSLCPSTRPTEGRLYEACLLSLAGNERRRHEADEQARDAKPDEPAVTCRCEDEDTKAKDATEDAYDAKEQAAGSHLLVMRFRAPGRLALRVWRVLWLLCEDLVAEPHTLVADEYAIRSRNETYPLVLVLATERANRRSGIAFPCHVSRLPCDLTSRQLQTITRSTASGVGRQSGQSWWMPTQCRSPGRPAGMS